MVASRPRLVWRVLLVITISAAAAFGGYWGTWLARERGHTSVTPGIAIPSVLGAAGATPSGAPAATPAPVPTAAGVARAIASARQNPALGARLLASVVDAQTGAVLIDSLATTPGAPASTAKLLTAAAVLTVHPASYRFTTAARVSGGTVYLVGGGDPTLSGAAAGQSQDYPGAARLSDLASALRSAKITPTQIVVDDALFSGPTTSPGWLPEDVPSSYGAGITALMTDGGRAAPGDAIRSSAPDIAAGHELAAALGKPSLPVTEGVAPGASTVAATVQSAPLSTLVEQMLQDSDNVIADVLARQVAVAEHQPASFTGATQATRTVLATLGVQVGTGMLDGSGLAAADRVSPASLVSLLRVVAGYGAAKTAASALIAGLPVAAWSGTLEDRYLTGAAHTAAGDVRAKTGSITGVTSLAGFVHDKSGRLLIFSFDADRTPAGGTAAAESALDDVAAALASCGCG